MSLKRFQRAYYMIDIELPLDDEDDEGEWTQVVPSTRIYYDEGLESLAIQMADGCAVDVVDDPDILKDCLSEYWEWEDPVAASVEQVVNTLKENSRASFLSLEHLKSPTNGDYDNESEHYDARTASTFKDDEEITLDDIKLIAYEALDFETQIYEHRDLPFVDKFVYMDAQGSIVAMFTNDEDAYELEADWDSDGLVSECLPALDAFESLSHAALIKSNGADDLMVYAAFATKEQAEQWLRDGILQGDGVIKKIKK